MFQINENENLLRIHFKTWEYENNKQYGIDILEKAKNTKIGKIEILLIYKEKKEFLKNKNACLFEAVEKKEAIKALTNIVLFG